MLGPPSDFLGVLNADINIQTNLDIVVEPWAARRAAVET